MEYAQKGKWPDITKEEFVARIKEDTEFAKQHGCFAISTAKCGVIGRLKMGAELTSLRGQLKNCGMTQVATMQS